MTENLQQLNLPEYPLRLRENNGRREIFDSIRRLWVALTPEEWVRQNLVRYLVTEKQMPETLIAIEKSLTLNSLTKRTDILVHSRQGKPLLLVECKAPQIAITQKVFEQIGRYNLALQVKYLVVTNGLQHYCARIDWHNQQFDFLEDIPHYNQLES
jgi:hypothetical protein